MPSQPPSQLSRTLQYLYFMRFSLLLWLFPVFFAALDSGRVTLSTTTLSRGIFVPEFASGYLCVAFFVIASGFVALITARTTAINGVERFNAGCPECVDDLLDQHDADCAAANEDINQPPRWLTWLLANPDARGEGWAVTVALVPSFLTFLYLIGCGTFEDVSVGQILRGLAMGTLIAAAVWYVLNAWYYLAYRRPDGTVPGELAVLGKNTARTILLPRAWYGLRRPGTAIDDDHPTLEDIKTRMDLNVFESVPKLVRGLGLPGTGYFDQQGRVYEAQAFSILAFIAFVELLGVMYAWTAPRFNRWNLLVLLAIPWSLAWILYVIWSATCQNRKLLLWWQAVLSTCAILFGASIIFLVLFSSPDRFPTLASVIVLAVFMGLVLSGLAFFLDRFRVPVLTFVLVLAVLPRVLHVYDFGGFEEHYISTVNHPAGPDRLPTPAQIINAHLPEASDAEDSHPLIIVTATGGGLHASAWMARVLRQVYLRLPREEWPSLTSHIALMSTVSGGSVGLSYYLEAIHKNPAAPDLDHMIVGAQCSSLEAVSWGLIYYDFSRAIVPLLPWFTPPSSGDGDLDSTPISKDRTWALRKAFERNSDDRYCYETANTNVPLALDLGAFPARASWRDRLFPDATSSTPRLTLEGLHAGGQFPAFTMNTTTVEAGERFLLANYRLPGYFVGSIEGPPAESFLDLLPGQEHPDLPLASAAQLSATFPYVSSAARIPGKYAMNSVHFVDGGYYDDDGTSSAIEFIRYALDAPAAGAGDAEQKNVMDKLKGNRRLRILLIEIRNDQDSDLQKIAKPPQALAPHGVTKPKSYEHAGLLQQLGFPPEGFWLAGHGSVTGRDRNGLDLLLQAHENTLELHQIIFDDATRPDSRWYVVSAKDPLSWSLTPRERGEVAQDAEPQPGAPRLLGCYQAVGNWFDSFDAQWKQAAHPREPTRCE